MRKSKFDTFIVHCPKTKRIIKIQWDCAINGLSQWWHFDGDKCWRVKDNKYLGKIPKLFTILYRLPEGFDWV